MRINQLTLCAFGPFKDTETIDFEKLNNKSIFLITGETGAGKTTIFDAICYALYGKGSGQNRSDPDNVRSHFAGLDVETYVELYFEVNKKRYRIKRRPTQMRQRRGNANDLVMVSHAVELEMPDGDIITKINEVSDKVKEILGVDYEQLKQIVLLPQGEFQKLLNATSEERTAIFRKIFDTRIYEAFQEHCRVWASNLKALVEEKATMLNTYYYQIESLDDEKIQTLLLNEERNADFILEALDEYIVSKAKLVKEADVCTKDLTKKKENLILVRQAAETMNQKIKELDSLKQKHIQLIISLPVMELKKQQITKAENALVVKPFYDAYGKSQEKLSNEQATLILLEKRQKQTEIDRAQSILEIETIPLLEKAIEELRNTKAILNKDSELFNEIDTLTNLLDAKVIENDTLSSKIKSLNNLLNELETKIINANEDKRKNEQIIASEADVVLEENLVNEAIKQLKSLQKSHAQFEQKQNQYDLIYNQYQNKYQDFELAQKNFIELEKLYFSNQAALLAGKLKDNEPCPVCGSKVHPNPAHLPSKALSEETYHEAKETYEQKRTLLENDKNALTSKKSELDTLKNSLLDALHLFDNLTFDGQLKAKIAELLSSLSSKFADLKAKHDAITIAKEKLVSLNEQIDEYIKKQKSYQEDLIKHEKQQAVISGEINNLQNDKTIKLNKLTSAYQSSEEIINKIQQTETEIINKTKTIETINLKFNEIDKKLATINQQCSDSLLRIESYKNELSINEANLMKELNQYFVNLDDYLASIIDKAELDKIKTLVNQFDKELTETSTQISMLSKEIKDQEIIDITNYTNEIDAIVEELNTITSKQKTIENALRIAEDSKKNIKRIVKEYRERETEYKQVRRIDEIARGVKSKITFERFILAYFFGEILRVANQRLSKMTGGRYRLHRKTEKSKGASQQGLDLMVYDNYTTKLRDVKTLSGGETFKAALSLALGLAEVVQSFSGGISLETIFIDEGFGTLDSESLDSAMDTLLDLNSSGRVVGIISHVEELKERIEAKLVIKTTNQGSYIAH